MIKKIASFFSLPFHMYESTLFLIDCYRRIEILIYIFFTRIKNFFELTEQQQTLIQVNLFSFFTERKLFN